MASTLAFGCAQFRLERADDGLGDLVLEGEQVLQLTVVALGPEVGARRCVDQLGADANALAGGAYAALQHVAHA
jgi:hypothetical protein